MDEATKVHIKELMVDFARFITKPTMEEKQAIREWALQHGNPTPEHFLIIWESLQQQVQVEIKVEEPEDDIIIIKQYLGLAKGWKDEGYRLSKKFKEWIENTSLFHALKHDHRGTRIVANDGSIGFYLDRNATVAEELPLEVVWVFYQNSPFYNQNNQQNNQNLLSDGS